LPAYGAKIPAFGPSYRPFFLPEVSTAGWWSRCGRAVWALVGSVAESASYVRGPDDAESDRDAVFEVVTGMLAPDTPFTPQATLFASS